MRIFLCYRHDANYSFVERLQRALLQAGHEVWSDASDERRPAQREAVALKIRASERTLALLSRYTVHDPAVCHDDLVLALAEGGDHSLVTVLLEDEQSVEPPLLVSHLQWVDMSAWRFEEARGEAAFNAWFQERFNVLSAALDNKTDPTIEIAELRGLLGLPQGPPPYVRAVASLLDPPFTGREWLVKKINAWLQESIPLASEQEIGHKIFCLCGGPGSGKSSLVAQFISCHKMDVVGTHFCTPEDDVSSVLLSLSFQLAGRLPDYRAFLLLSLNGMPQGQSLSGCSAEELFTYLFSKAAHMTVDGGRRRFALVLDSLDSAGADLVRLLAQKVSSLPRWLRIIATSRPGASHVAAHLHSITVQNLAYEGKETFADVALLAAHSLAALPKDRARDLATFVCDKARGNMLVAKALINQLLEEPGEAGQTYPPPAIFPLYRSYLQKAVPDMVLFGELIKPVLAVLVANSAPMSENAIYASVRKTHPALSRSDITETALPMLGGLLHSDGDDISLFHESFALWLASPASGEYSIASP